MLTKQKNFRIPKEELFSHGTLSCPGCGERLALRYMLKGLGKKTIMVVPACCAVVADGFFPFSASRIPYLNIPFETTASSAAGVRAAYKVLKQERATVLGWAGDGGTYDIGLQAISASAERNDDFIYACYDNEAYMNTGNQRSSATPLATHTTTTPGKASKKQEKKNIIEILAAHRIPYIASVSIAYPEDFIKKVRKAKKIRGFRFILILSPCPTGWKFSPELSIKIARLAVETKIFPVYEIIDGRVYSIFKDFNPQPVEEYLSLQGRFAHLKKNTIKRIQKRVDEEWDYLLMREKLCYLNSTFHK